MIPRVLHRTVPNQTTEQVEAWWQGFQALHPNWECRTWRDPLGPAEFPLTAHAWSRCTSGAQRAGLIRLELLLTFGGVYVDSDVEPLRSLEALLPLHGFSGWESDTVAPDAVLGAEPGHPAIARCLELALERLDQGAWISGPGVTTEVLPGRDDWLMLPPGAFYAVHFTLKHLPDAEWARPPWALVLHHWFASWC